MILPFGVLTTPLPHRNIFSFSSSICIKQLILRYRCLGEEKTHLFYHPYIQVLVFTLFFSFTFSSPWIREFLSLFGPQIFTRKRIQKPIFRVSFSLSFSISSTTLYEMSKQSEGSAKRKRPQKDSFLDTTARTSIHIVDDFAILISNYSVAQHLYQFIHTENRPCVLLGSSSMPDYVYLCLC